MFDRREFLKTAAAGGLGLSLDPSQLSAEARRDNEPDALPGRGGGDPGPGVS